jgi:GDP-4-dehydro-6-deoxy-D-mannose reductase
VTARRILVTGIGGFVGPYLAARLRRDGHTVLGLGAEQSPATVRASLEYEWTADLRNATAVAEAVAGAHPDAIIHLAAQSSASRSFAAPAETFAINVVGTWNLLEAVRAHVPRARVLAVGTGEVYGPQPPGTRVTEDTSFAPVSPYALSKAAADSAAEFAHRVYGLDVVRARAFSHAGPDQTSTFVIPSWARQIAAIERGNAEPVLRVGNLDVTRDLTDVRDVVAAYAVLLEHGGAGEVYNVCRGEGVSLRELASRMVAMAHRPIRVEVDPSLLRPADVPWLVGDPSRLATLGWCAAIPLATTLEDVLTDWRSRRS